jgi:hypothetical protein
MHHSFAIQVVAEGVRPCRIDEEEFGGHGQLAGEGLAPSAALFVVRCRLS